MSELLPLPLPFVELLTAEAHKQWADQMLAYAHACMTARATPSGWQDIATAPRDGSMFLFNAPDMECGVSIGYYDSTRLRLGLDGKPIGPHVSKPTHWMPLPEPPK